MTGSSFGPFVTFRVRERERESQRPGIMDKHHRHVYLISVALTFILYPSVCLLCSKPTTKEHL